MTLMCISLNDVKRSRGSHASNRTIKIMLLLVCYRPEGYVSTNMRLMILSVYLSGNGGSRRT